MHPSKHVARHHRQIAQPGLARTPLWSQLRGQRRERRRCIESGEVTPVFFRDGGAGNSHAETPLPGEEGQEDDLRRWRGRAQPHIVHQHAKAAGTGRLEDELDGRWLIGHHQRFHVHEEMGPVGHSQRDSLFGAGHAQPQSVRDRRRPGGAVHERECEAVDADRHGDRLREMSRGAGPQPASPVPGEGGRVGGRAGRLPPGEVARLERAVGDRVTGRGQEQFESRAVVVEQHAARQRGPEATVRCRHAVGSGRCHTGQVFAQRAGRGFGKAIMSRRQGDCGPGNGSISQVTHHAGEEVGGEHGGRVGGSRIGLQPADSIARPAAEGVGLPGNERDRPIALAEEGR